MSWFGHSAFGFILPFMEQGAQYSSLNYSLRANSIGNTTAYYSVVSSFICPSDLPAPPRAGFGFSQSSYGMSRGTQENIYENWAAASFPDPAAEQASKCNAALGNGMFGAENSVKVAMITDGTSNTTMFGELSRFKNDTATAFNFWHFTAAFGMTNFGGGYFSGEVRPGGGAFTYPRLNALPDRTGQSQNAVFCGCGSGNCIPSDWLDPKCANAVRNLGQFGFRSNHPGGANFAMADGSVKFIKSTINDVSYMAIGTRAGGEVISADSL